MALWTRFSNPNQNGRFLWSYDQNSKLVISVGSGSNFCWMIKNPEKNTNRVKITACNETDVNQHFEFFSDGRFVPSVRKDLCVSYSLKNVDGILNSGALKIAKCWGTSFLPAQEIFEVANEKFEMCNGVPFLEGKLKCCNDELVVSHDKNCEDFEVSVCSLQFKFIQKNFLAKRYCYLFVTKNCIIQKCKNAVMELLKRWLENQLLSLSEHQRMEITFKKLWDLFLKFDTLIF